MVIRFVIVTLVMFGTFAKASETTQDSSQFQLDKDLVNSLYKEAVTEAKIETRKGSSRLKVLTEFSYLVPTALTLSNQYFDVEYGDNFSGLPGVNIAIGQSILNWKSISLSLLGKVGFSRKESLTIVRTKAGTPFRDMIQLSRIPLTAGFRTDFAFSDTATVKPYVETLAGVKWLYQSGKLDRALEQGIWIQFLSIG